MEEKEKNSEIPQIKPQDEPKGDPGVEDKPQEESILVPKITPEAQEKPALGVSSKVSNKEPKKPLSARARKVLIGVGIAVAVIILTIVLPSILVFSSAKKLVKSVEALKYVASIQDVNAVKNELGNTKKALGHFSSRFKLLSWTKILPLIGSFTRDVEHGTKAGNYSLEAAEITIAAIEPYMDVLGFNNLSEDGAKTAEERIDFFVKAIPELIPKVDDISQKVNLAKAEINQINPERYPIRLGKRVIREPIKTALDNFDTAAGFILQAKPLLEASPYLLGLDETRYYLVLFQNDKELRPTGGFLTAYSIMKVDEAKFEPVTSDDIYNLDAKYRPTIPAPEALVKYIKGPYILSKNIRLRDINWSPDFSESMRVFTEEAEGVGLEDIDGVIGVDTQLLVNLLNAIGPIGVPGFGNFSTDIEPECNCPQVIYELESFADVEGPIVWDPVSGEIVYSPPNSDNRKRIIGPLMNSILANAMGQPKEKLPALFEAVFKSLTEKHVLFYLFDSKAQAGVEAFNIAGRVKDSANDYLYINDANLGGRKSNLYVTQEVEQQINVAKDGTVEKTLVITYKNPEKHDGWLNSVLPNWVRIYVPKGSELIEMEGVEDKADPYEELGKTVFAGFFQLRPEGVAKVIVKYKLPFKVDKDYRLLIQKQPGKDAPLYVITLGKKHEELFLKTDKEFRLQI